MKKVFKFVKGKKDEKKESGGISSSQSGDLLSPVQTPEDEKFLGLDNVSGYIVDFCGKDKTLTKLHKAAWQGSLEKLKSALKKVEIDAVDRHNRTALHFAVVQGHPNIVWFLLGNNAKTAICDDEGRTPLLKAIECGHKECMTLLLERGTDINVADYTGNTGLHIATTQGSLDTASLLLQKGADTEVSNNAGDYPLHIATKLENKDLVDLLLNSGASVDVLDRENRTPLMMAAKSGNLLLTQLFVDRGAQLKIVDSNGWTALDYAILAGHESVAASLKSLSDSKKEKNEEEAKQDDEKSVNDAKSDENSESWSESKTEKSNKDPITQKLKEFFKQCSKEEAEKEKVEDSLDSPNDEVMPPYCQPPKSWEMIQAGMIDGNKGGTIPKRRSITTLGTLHSRRESFSETLGTTSPKYTLSLNRRKHTKPNNSFAKQRFSFNEEESLKYWINEDKSFQKDLGKIEMENISNFEPVGAKKIISSEKKHSTSESDWDSDVCSSVTASEETNKSDLKSNICHSESGTLGFPETMQGTEEMWIANSHLSPPSSKEEHRNSWDSEDTSLEKEGNFPPPPSALELGVDMAKSIKYMKGISIDRPMGSTIERNLWKNSYESHSLDYLEEKDFTEVPKVNTFKGHTRQQSFSSQKWRSEEISNRQKPCDRLVDVNRRINEQLECYDQALRELAESSTSEKALVLTSEKMSEAHNYYSLPSSKSGEFKEQKKTNSLDRRGDKGYPDSGPFSMPCYLTDNKPQTVENNEKLGLEVKGKESNQTNSRPKEKLEKKTKKHMLLTMREIKHAVHVTNTFKTSLDDQILSPLTKPEDSFEINDKLSPQPESEGTSPGDENPFFGIVRQETVLERNELKNKSSSSSTGEEPTLWLQEDLHKRTEPKNNQMLGSDDEVSDISEEAATRHKRTSSFSPLGVIYREIQKENQSSKNVSSSSAELRGKPEGGEAQKTKILLNQEEIKDENLMSEDFNNETEDNVREPSPDISLSSGPIEPLGTEKDSGSDPESSHNDVTPTHNYSLKAQQEWLKCHLKTANIEKNKLEEITAQLSEKTERLQYELADAKEAARSRDEVIQLLQGQLARMEAAYTKSLEESVQSRLQLTSHEQEIIHLKELCYKYEEEKDNAAAEKAFEELESKIKTLEEEKKKMKEEIDQLEQEKYLLEKRLKEVSETEIIDQCQRWKERCDELGEQAYNAQKVANELSMKNMSQQQSQREEEMKERNLELEKKHKELSEENFELKSKLQDLLLEVQTEKMKTCSKKGIDETVIELNKKNTELESHLEKLEKEMEEKTIEKLKEKEEEVQELVKRFNSERESLIALYEKKLMEQKSEYTEQEVENCKKKNERLKQMIKNLQDQVANIQIKTQDEDANQSLRNELLELKLQCNLFSKSIVEMQNRDQQDLTSLMIENLSLKKEIMELKMKVFREEADSPKPELLGTVHENLKMKNKILDLKNQVNSLTKLLDRGASIDSEVSPGSHYFRSQRGSEGDQRITRKRGVGREDELAWGSLYGMKASRRSRGERFSVIGLQTSDRLDPEESAQGQKTTEVVEQLNKEMVSRQNLEFLELKKEIIHLQSKMSNEKNLREALQTQVVEMNLDLKEKQSLEQEINSLKRKIDRDCVQRSEMELLQCQKELDSRRDQYLEWKLEKESTDKDYKAKCEMLAKEREKSKEIRAKLNIKSRSFDLGDRNSKASNPIRFNSYPQAQPKVMVHPQFEIIPSFVLEPEIKSRLEKELDRSIQKYVNGSPSGQPVSSLQLELLKKKYCP